LLPAAAAFKTLVILVGGEKEGERWEKENERGREKEREREKERQREKERWKEWVS